jgi:hypothetical protein
MVGQVTPGGKLVRNSPAQGGNAREKFQAEGGMVVRNDTLSPRLARCTRFSRKRSLTRPYTSRKPPEGVT